MKQEIINLCKEQPIDTAALLAIISVETPGQGFDTKTGKILIQFEPVWFRREAPYAPSGLWSVNKVDVQSKEWLAFNNAFSKNADAAMQATSIGLGQIMGLHYKRLGYKTVGAMWDDAKKGIKQQIEQLVKFIQSDEKLQSAIEHHNWTDVAEIYNGKGFRELAAKYPRTPYDKALEDAYYIYRKQV
jgi:Protein of unknown function (DUF3380).